MSKVLKEAVPIEKLNDSGPNYLGYYKHKLVELLSQNEGPLAPMSCQDSDSSACRPSADINVQDVDVNVYKGGESTGNSGLGSLFGSGIEEGLSGFQKDRVKEFLKQSVAILDQEVDEMLEEVLAVSWIRTHPKEKLSTSCSTTENGDMGRSFSKKQKISSSPLSKSTHRHAVKECLPSHGKVNQNLHALLGNGGLLSEEVVNKHSDELFAKLGHMEKQLEEFLDIMMFKCRSMTRPEKEQLRHQIAKLPVLALERVVEIIGRRNLSEVTACDEINIDLEEEDKVTLWRLYYYVKAVESASAHS